MLMLLAVAFGLVTAVCAIVLLVAAFKESVSQGLLSLFVPLYIVYYAFARYTSPRKPVVVGLWLASLAAAVTCQVLFVRQAALALNEAMVGVQKDLGTQLDAEVKKEQAKEAKLAVAEEAAAPAGIDAADPAAEAPSRVAINANALYEQYTKADGMEILEKWGHTDVDLDGKVNRTAVVGAKTMVWLDTAQAKKFIQVDVAGHSKFKKGEQARFSCGRIAGMTDDFLQVQDCKVAAAK